MTYADFLIIYLACGAPFGVYYFFQNRRRLRRNYLWLNSFLTTTVWFPYAFRLLQEIITKKLIERRRAQASRAAARRKNKFDRIEKQIAGMLLGENVGIALFDFREAFARYVGLTVALENASQGDATAENAKEFLRAAGAGSVELAARCSSRRNLARLRFHQNAAQGDLIEMFSVINAELGASDDFKALAFDLCRLLNKANAEKALAEIFNSASQTADQRRVPNTEQDLWKTKPDQPQFASPTALKLRAVSVTATSKPD